MNVRLERITLCYPGKEPLFRDLDLEVGDGELVVIRGPSGSGKSSLLRLINRLQEPTSGRLLIDGEPAATLEVTRLRRRIATIQQTPVMIDGTVRDNLHLPFRFEAARHRGDSSAGSSPARPDLPEDDTLRSELAAYHLDDVDLEHDATLLSVGQKQRLALIRALFVEPELILCDEPTSALDPASRQVVEAELERRHRELGQGIILVTHIDGELDRLATRSLVLADGELHDMESV